MSKNPSALLKIHTSASNPLNEDNAEDVLFELLHSLSELPSPSFLPSSQHLFNWTTRYLFQEDYLPDINAGIDTYNQSDYEVEWRCGLVLLRKMISFSRGNTNGNSTPICNPSIMPPHVLLRCTLERCLGYSSSIHERADDVPLSQFKILCVLLASTALHNCSSIEEKRWRRTQSMCMEAISLYQQLLLHTYTMEIDNGRAVELMHARKHEIVIITKLYNEYLSPSLCNLLNEMGLEKVSNSPKGANEYKTKAIGAGMVNIASTLAFYITESTIGESDEDMEMGRALVFDLANEMLNIPCFGQEYIWMHAHRNEYEMSRSLEIYRDIEYGEEEESLVESHAEERILRELSPLLCQEINEMGLDFDFLCAMRTKWHTEGLSLMLHTVRSVTNRAEFTLSGVYSGELMLEIHFPLVAVLLNLSQRESNEGEEEAGRSIQLERKLLTIETKKRQRYFSDAIDALKYVFHWMDYKHGTSSDKLTKSKGALDPVGTIQLLLNHLINTSSSNHSISPEAVDQNIVTPQCIIGCIRRILTGYSVDSQLSSIRILMNDCPFPFLMPMLIDFLRSTVSSDEFRDLEGALDLIEPFFGAMKNECLHDIRKLNENIEVYTSVVSFFRLLCLKPKIIGRCGKRMKRTLGDMEVVKSALQNIFQEKNCSDSDFPIFRLFLLDSALDDLFLVRDRLL